MDSHNYNQKELQIALNLVNNIRENNLIGRDLSSLDRIIQIYFKQKKRNISEEKQVIEFLFQYLDIHGSDASILFSHLSESSERENVIQRLHDEYKDKFDFNIVNSLLFESSFQVISLKRCIFSLLFFITFLFSISIVFYRKNIQMKSKVEKYDELFQINKNLNDELTNIKVQFNEEFNNKRQLKSDIKTKSNFESESTNLKQKIEDNILTKQELDNEIKARKNLEEELTKMKKQLDEEIQLRKNIENKLFSKLQESNKVIQFKNNNKLKIFLISIDLILQIHLLFVVCYLNIKNLEIFIILAFIEILMDIIGQYNNSIIFTINSFLYIVLILIFYVISDSYIFSYNGGIFRFEMSYVICVTNIKYVLFNPIEIKIQYYIIVTIITTIEIFIFMMKNTCIESYVFIFELCFYIVILNQSYSIFDLTIIAFFISFILCLFYLFDKESPNNSIYYKQDIILVLISSIIKIMVYLTNKKKLEHYLFISIDFIIEIIILIINYMKKKTDFIILLSFIEFSLFLLALNQSFGIFVIVSIFVIHCIISTYSDFTCNHSKIYLFFVLFLLIKYAVFLINII